MNTPTLVNFSFSLLLNADLLLALAQVIDLALSKGHTAWVNRSSIGAGLLIGLICVLLTKISATLLPGIIFDTRSVLLAISGLFIGPVPTLTAMLTAALYRGLLGGPAALTGLSVILASGLIGLLWRRTLPGPVEEIGWHRLFALGLIVHAVMLALMLTLPWEMARTVLATVGLPVLIIHPLLSLALGLLIIERLRRPRDLDALRASEERTRRIVENAPDLIFINRDDRIHYINPAGIRLLGMHTAEEIVGRSIYDLFHPDSHAAVRARIAILRSGPGVSVPVLQEVMLGIDDSLLPAEEGERAALSPPRLRCRGAARPDLPGHHPPGRPRNGSRRRPSRPGRRDQALRHGETLYPQGRRAGLGQPDRLARTQARRHARLLHLGGRGHHRSQTDEQRDRLEKIVGASGHLLRLVNEVLDLSKIESGRLILESAPFNLDALLRDSAALLAERARARGLALAVELDPLPEREPILIGDATGLRQILLNYVGNAIKFTEQGLIRMRARVIETDEEEILLRLEVEDSGIGIPADDQERLFRAFEQLDASTTRRYGGTGLRLAINRRLAELMGGAIGFESRPGAGSLFWATARLRRGNLAGYAAARPAEPREGTHGRADLPRGAHLLLVEDNPINQEVAYDILTESGTRVDVVDNGAQAVAMAEQTAYDAILMDMHMPVMDGLEATRRIRTLADRHDTPIIAKTASAFDDDRRRCLDAGMNDYIAKPFDPEALYALLRRWIIRPTAGVPETDAETAAGTLGVSPAASCAQAPITPDRDEIDALLDTLDRLLSLDDAEVDRVFADAAPTLRRSLGEEIVTLGRMLDAYDYPAALERVCALRARPQGDLRE